MKKPTSVKVGVKLPFLEISGEWEVNEIQRKAAWSLYVELMTRIAVQPLEMGRQAYAREALTSLYSLFPTTREILKEAGPEAGASSQSVGGIAIAVLNRGLRPFLSQWHPELQAWEAHRPPEVSPVVHEMNWLREPEFRAELETLQKGLDEYAHALATIAGVEE
jgi:hypothetical protein